MPYPLDESAESVAPLRVLVADDDAISRCFLTDGLRKLGADVVACADGEAALVAARLETFDLLLLDCCMPHGGATGVLRRLREDPHAASAASIAIASSAELEPPQRHALLEAGFKTALLKPCTLADLAALLASIRPRTTAVLDDRQALNNTGSPAIMQALRAMFRQELVDVCAQLDLLRSDPVSLQNRLHKLRSSCGFCGAASLSETIVTIQAQLDVAEKATLIPLDDFRAALKRTLQALDAQPATSAPHERTA